MESANGTPLVHIRIHSDYQSSLKGLAPDVTVTVNVPSLPLDVGGLADAIVQARMAAVDEFQRAVSEAWGALKTINQEMSK